MTGDGNWRWQRHRVSQGTFNITSIGMHWKALQTHSQWHPHQEQSSTPCCHQNTPEIHREESENGWNPLWSSSKAPKAPRRIAGHHGNAQIHRTGRPQWAEGPRPSSPYLFWGIENPKPRCLGPKFAGKWLYRPGNEMVSFNQVWARFLTNVKLRVCNLPIWQLTCSTPKGCCSQWWHKMAQVKITTVTLCKWAKSGEKKSGYCFPHRKPEFNMT